MSDHWHLLKVLEFVRQFQRCSLYSQKSLKVRLHAIVLQNPRCCHSNKLCIKISDPAKCMLSPARL